MTRTVFVSMIEAKDRRRASRGEQLTVRRPSLIEGIPNSIHQLIRRRHFLRGSLVRTPEIGGDGRPPPGESHPQPECIGDDHDDADEDRQGHRGVILARRS